MACHATHKPSDWIFAGMFATDSGEKKVGKLELIVAAF